MGNPHLLKNCEYIHIANIIYQNGKHFSNQTVTIKIFKYFTKVYDHRILKQNEKFSKAHNKHFMIYHANKYWIQSKKTKKNCDMRKI